MKVTVRITNSFKIAAKPLLKKYHSLSTDLLTLEKELLKTPKLGIPLGMNSYKIRLKISSKGKGKSGGARVISLVETTLLSIAQISDDEEITVNLITIFDKADVDNFRQRTESAYQKLQSNVKTAATFSLAREISSAFRIWKFVDDERHRNKTGCIVYHQANQE